VLLIKFSLHILAIHTEHLKALWEVVSLKPIVEQGTAFAFSSVLSSTTINMVNRENSEVCEKWVVRKMQIERINALGRVCSRIMNQYFKT
jgi:hypothetical protein